MMEILASFSILDEMLSIFAHQNNLAVTYHIWLLGD